MSDRGVRPSKRKTGFVWAAAIAILAIATALFAYFSYFGGERDEDRARASRTEFDALADDAVIVRTLAAELDDPRIAALSDLSAEQARKIANVDDIGFRFQGDFNADGQQDLALLGQYRSGDRLNSFLLLASRGADTWTRSALFTFEERFIIGRQYDSGLAVFFCVGCDDGGRIDWTGTQYAYNAFPAPGVR